MLEGSIVTDPEIIDGVVDSLETPISEHTNTDVIKTVDDVRHICRHLFDVIQQQEHAAIAFWNKEQKTKRLLTARHLQIEFDFQ